MPMVVDGIISPMAVTLGPITLAAPALAWGLIGAAVPVLIHLLIRRRPRLQVLPTTRLLLAYAAADLRAQRLRYLILMACRVLLVVLLVGLLMRLGCGAAVNSDRPVWHAAPDRPVSAVICVDDSASMGYRSRGQTRLRHAVDWALELLRDRRRFPQGSEVAVVTGSSAGRTGLSRDAGTRDRRLAGLRPAFHDRGPAALLREAYGLLANGRNQLKEVYLLTDLAEHAWQGPLPTPPDNLSAVFVMDAGGDENDNLFLGIPDSPEPPLAVDAPGEISVTVRAGDQPAEPVLELAIDGSLRERKSVGPLAPREERQVSLSLSRLPEGNHAVSVSLLPGDALAADNQRFVWVEVRAAMPVVLVADDPDEEVPRLLAAMIEPGAMKPGWRAFQLRRCRPSALSLEVCRDAGAIVLADVAGLEESNWPILIDYVSAGGLLLIVPGPRTTPAALSAGRSILPAEVVRVADCPQGLTLAAADFSHPWLEPFADVGIDSINDRAVFRRVELGPASSEAVTVAPFADGRPAILARRHGRGQIVFLAFSPARQWGAFGSQAAPMIVFLRHLLSSRTPFTRERLASFVARTAETRGIPGVDSGVVSVEHGEPRQELRIPVRGGLAELPTGEPGFFRVMIPPPEGRTVLVYGVNVAETESDLRRAPENAILSRFPSGKAAVVRRRNAEPGPFSGLSDGVDWMPILGLALLGLLVIETLFANRVYGLWGISFSRGDPRFRG
ncbi:MAG TPA: BatA and WFA domain-containing protein [Phycisphaerae bacterium]|nr:BatA and WFA domain-containing protein [Phycisphaerae bacterium]